MPRRTKEVPAGRRRRLIPGLSLLTAGAVVTGAITGAEPAEAFKPYTHVKSGEAAYLDVTDDGFVTIEGREYAVDPVLVDALRDWRPYYNAGVIGPDGFPDLVMGQEVIHPEETGQWLDYVLTQAWAAQQDPSYGEDERGQILAFAYGFLTHAAGDLWAHTLVNEFARETFPGVGEVLTDKDAAEVALRHLIAEGYIGDATEGYDGNPDRTTLPDGDTSDDETAGIAFAASGRTRNRIAAAINNAMPDAMASPRTTSVVHHSSRASSAGPSSAAGADNARPRSAAGSRPRRPSSATSGEYRTPAPNDAIAYDFTAPLTGMSLLA